MDIDGRTSPPGKSLQLVTNLDVVGENSGLFHRDSVAGILDRFHLVTLAYFSELMGAETNNKPGFYTTIQGQTFY